MGVSGQRLAQAAIYPRGKDPSTHWIENWVGPRAGLDAEARRKIICPCRGLSPVLQSVGRHYTDGTTGTPSDNISAKKYGAVFVKYFFFVIFLVPILCIISASPHLFP
jgi:hypothetical protein